MGCPRLDAPEEHLPSFLANPPIHLLLLNLGNRPAANRPKPVEKVIEPRLHKRYAPPSKYPLHAATDETLLPLPAKKALSPRAAPPPGAKRKSTAGRRFPHLFRRPNALQAQRRGDAYSPLATSSAKWLSTEALSDG